MIMIRILISGIVATLAMTVFMNICAWISRRNMHVIAILSKMLPGFFDRKGPEDQSRYRPMAFLLHYSIGIVFAFLYHVWRSSEGSPDYQSMAEPWILGFLLGMIAVAGWTLFIRIHPAPLLTVPWEQYLVCVFIGHIIFSFAMIACYQFMDPLKVHSI